MHKQQLLGRTCRMQNPISSTRSMGSQIRSLSISATEKASVTAFKRRPSTKIPNPSSTSNPFELGSRREDFKRLEATRPPFDASAPTTIYQTPDTRWTYGKGVNSPPPPAEHHKPAHISIDPYASSRTMIQNYKLLISAVPRPISFISTVSKDGKRNLAPFSYFQVVDHDPPIFVVGFSARANRPKDTRVNLVETGECVISVVSEHMIEGVNATSMDVPVGTSEWEISGFEAAPSETVRPERVADAVFSVEGRLLEMKELDYGGEHEISGKPSGGLAVIQATRFWVREDAVKGDEVDLEVLRPLVQLGGISYGRVRETFELPRPRLREEMEDERTGLRRILDWEEIAEQ